MQPYLFNDKDHNVQLLACCNANVYGSCMQYIYYPSIPSMLFGVWEWVQLPAPAQLRSGIYMLRLKPQLLHLFDAGCRDPTRALLQFSNLNPVFLFRQAASLFTSTFFFGLNLLIVSCVVAFLVNSSKTPDQRRSSPIMPCNALEISPRTPNA